MNRFARTKGKKIPRMPDCTRRQDKEEAGGNRQIRLREICEKKEDKGATTLGGTLRAGGTSGQPVHPPGKGFNSKGMLAEKDKTKDATPNARGQGSIVRGRPMILPNSK